MKQENKTLRMGTAAVAGAVLLRLLSGNLPGKLIRFFSKPETVAALTFLETGTMYRPPVTEESPTPTEPEATEPAPSVPEQVQFHKSDADLISVNNHKGGSIQASALLEAPLSWELATTEPTVLILHTHATESYTGSWEGKDPYRNLQPDKNMLAIGALIKTRLEQAGIRVIHDQVLHDYPSYNNSYSHARKSTKSYLEQYPSIRLVLDIHRDAVQDSSGKQVQTTVNIGEQTSAQLMAVVGSNGTGLSHADWQTNMALAVKLHVQLEKMYPGITRPISLRAQRFNQDLSSGAMLIEVGSAGNTLEQSLIAADCLADALIALSHGTA